MGWFVLAVQTTLVPTSEKPPGWCTYKKTGRKQDQRGSDVTHRVRLTFFRICGRESGEGFCRDRERAGQTWREGKKEKEREEC